MVRTPRRRLPSLHGHELSILLVLVLTLGLAGLLAHQAQHAIRSHRAAAEAALHDHAAFASWELGRRLEEALQAPLHAAAMHARLTTEIELTANAAGAHDSASAKRFHSVLMQQLEACACSTAVRDVFALDLGSGAASFIDNRLGAEARARIAAAVLSETRTSRSARARPTPPPGPPLRASIRTRTADGSRLEDIPSPQITVMLHGGTSTLQPFVVRPLPGDADARLVHTVLRDVGGNASGAYGFVLDVRRYAAPIVRDVVERADVLPPSLMRGRSNAQVLAVRVHTMEGVELHRTAGAQPDVGEVVDTVHTPLAAFVTAVAVQPSEIATLLIGGLPASRLPLLLAVFVITLMLAAVAAVQLRRHQALVRLRSDFVSGVSHELRTPLTQISMFAELLEQDRLGPTDAHRSIRIISEEARRLRYLVDNILHFSRPTHDRGRDAHSTRLPTDLGRLACDVVESFAPLARSRDATITVDAGANLVADVEPHAVRQVLLNLLDNAVKYGPPGQHVRVGVVRSSGAVVLSVEDSGPGIPRESRDAVWQPYRRLARDMASATTGSGIGLAVVQAIVTAHGGRTRIEGGSGGGARVVVELPRSLGGGPPAATSAGLPEAGLETEPA